MLRERFVAAVEDGNLVLQLEDGNTEGLPVALVPGLTLAVQTSGGSPSADPTYRLPTRAEYEEHRKALDRAFCELLG